MSGLITVSEFKYSDAETIHPNHDYGAPGNCLDGNTYSSWKPNLQSNFASFDMKNAPPTIINSLGLSGVKNIHPDLNSILLYGAMLEDMSDIVEVARLSKTDIENGILLNNFDNEIIYNHYRVTVAYFTGVITEIEISNIIIGHTVEIPNGVGAPYTPPKLSAKTEILNNKTMGGHFVGRSVLSGQYDFIIKNKNITPEWIEENWLSLHKQISEKPFMYLWDDTRPQDAVFCWTKGDIPPPKYDNQCYFSFSIPCNGFIEND